MKRTCLACRKKELNWRMFAFNQFMTCNACGQTFRYSLKMRLANFLNIMLVPLANYIFFGNVLILVFVIIISFLIVVLITQFLPVVPSEPIENSIHPPTNVEIERTDDVTENIRRYKEAQRRAMRKDITN